MVTNKDKYDYLGRGGGVYMNQTKSKPISIMANKYIVLALLLLCNIGIL